MIKRFTVTALLLSNIILSSASFGQEMTGTIKGPYMGQKPPGMTPTVFAPGIISTEGWEVSGVFTPDLNEYYYIRMVNNGQTLEQQFVVFRNLDDQWTEKVISPRVGQPFISPDGNIMHLGTRFKQRTPTGWSDIKTLGPAFEQYRIMRLTVSATGTYVFDEATRDGKGQLRYSKLLNGARQNPQPLPETINTGKWNAHPFIAPDESYIIWDGQRGSEVRNADLFVSFKQEDGSWGDAIKMGDNINTPSSEAGARVTPDGKYLFFNRKVGSFDWKNESGAVESIANIDVFWVDAGVIEALRPEY